jgi:methylenetetrahydrofolate dehydrogenase (NADP+)/methenyltetrahydrofolate cyclohydrolase
MMPVHIEGNALKARILDQLTADVATCDSPPGLAVVLVGDNPASQAYVGMKKKACAAIGIRSFEFTFSAESPQADVIALIDTLNDRSDVHGILVQMPLPDHMDPLVIVDRIDPYKDVDGFHPVNMGNLLIGRDSLKPCTPYGVAELLKEYAIDTVGKHVVIIGRSVIVGKPMAAILVQNTSNANATVTLCHSRTHNLAAITRSADIVIAAIGRPGFVTADMVADGAVVIDVGINRIVDKSSPKGYRLVGDVDFDGVAPKSSAITPVPGGVGPMTIAMLMTNTVTAYRRLRAQSR